MSGPYLLKYWGSIEEAEDIGAHMGSDAREVWFETDAERAAYVQRLRVYADKRGKYCVMSDDLHGPDCMLRTVAVCILRYEGKDYHLECDFGFGYPDHGVDYMWNEGNYACDCNRSLFLHRKYPDVPELEECGNTIELVDLRIEHREPTQPIAFTRVNLTTGRAIQAEG